MLYFKALNSRSLNAAGGYVEAKYLNIYHSSIKFVAVMESDEVPEYKKIQTKKSSDEFDDRCTKRYAAVNSYFEDRNEYIENYSNQYQYRPYNPALMIFNPSDAKIIDILDITNVDNIILLMNKYNVDVNIKRLLCRNDLPESFLEKFSSDVNWDAISRYRELSEDFIYKYRYKLNWRYVCIASKMSEDFMDKVSEFLKWRKVAQYQTLSEDFVERHIDELNLKIVFRYQNLSMEFMDDHKDKYFID